MSKAFDNLQTRAEKAEALVMEERAEKLAERAEKNRLREILKENGWSDEEISDGHKKSNSSGLVF